MSNPLETGGVTITVRLIRSFPHRNIKHLVLHNVDLLQSTESFMALVEKDLETRSGIPPPFKKFKYDTFKIQHKAHGSKTSNPIIVIEDDENLILQPNKSLTENGLEHETEVSFFKLVDYEEYKANPQTTW